MALSYTCKVAAFLQGLVKLYKSLGLLKVAAKLEAIYNLFNIAGKCDVVVPPAAKALVEAIATEDEDVVAKAIAECLAALSG